MTPDVARNLLLQMQRIRSIEEEIARRYPEGKMRCPTHLSIGQEAVAAGVGVALKRDDLAVSGHRAHAHYIGKGGNVSAMLAEIYGRRDGCCKGKGGSMHLIDESAGFMGSTAIVAGTVPVGVGLALGMKLKGSSNVSCVFHGDAVVEAGVFFESVSFAVLKKLPVIFICENNQYSVYTHLRDRQPAGRSIAAMVGAMGLPTADGDGNNVAEVHRMTTDALAEIRAGGGPRFLEFSTYRWREHCGPNYDNDIGYRTEAEFLDWKARDPIDRFKSEALSLGQMTREDIARLERDVVAEVDSAFAFAEASPFPEQESAYADLYANENVASVTASRA